VTLAVAAINVGWLFPLALLVARGQLGGALGIVIAGLPLAAEAFWLDAGSPPRAPSDGGEIYSRNV
jgi:Fuc2NAc and GlcNAc transferase